MNRKTIPILVMLAAAFLILLIGFYYGCRSGSDSQQVSLPATPAATQDHPAPVLTGPSGADLFV